MQVLLRHDLAQVRGRSRGRREQLPALQGFANQLETGAFGAQNWVTAPGRNGVADLKLLMVNLIIEMLSVASQNSCANLPPYVCENVRSLTPEFQPVLPSNRPTARRNAHAACANGRDFARRSAALLHHCPEIAIRLTHQSPGNAAPDETIAVTLDRFAPAKSRRQVG